MTYKKTLPPTQLKKVDVLAAKGAFNIGCFVQGGKLFPAINSVKRLNALTEKASASWYSSLTNQYALYTRNRLYISNGTMSSPLALNFTAASPSMVELIANGVGSAYIFGDSNWCRLSGLNYTNTFKGNVVNCVFKNGRLFGVDRTQANKIRWSGEGGLDDWTENISGAGWAFVQQGYGTILNLIVYKEKIVAVRQYGLTFFTAYGTPENYKMSHLERRLPKIYKNTVAVWDEKLLFYTEEGLCSYDGNKIEKVKNELAEEIESPVFCCCADGKYYLCGVSKTLKRKAMLVYDLVRGVSYIVDVEANAVSVGPRIFAYSDTYEYWLEEGGTYTFTSGELDFSSGANKVLKEVVIKGANDVQLEVSNGVISRIVGGVRGKFRPNMRGKSFKIRVCGSGEIDGISAVAEVTDEV